jgi:hypothetical protein
MVGQMMHPSSPDKHGITVYSWEYLLKFTAFWDIALCRLVEIDRYFRHHRCENLKSHIVEHEILDVHFVHFVQYS